MKEAFGTISVWLNLRAGSILFLAPNGAFVQRMISQTAMSSEGKYFVNNEVKVKVKQSCYRPEVVQRLPGS